MHKAVAGNPAAVLSPDSRKKHSAPGNTVLKIGIDQKREISVLFAICW